MTAKIKDLPNSERPYEKLEMYGETMLSNSELLAIIIKTGTKEETAVGLAQRILNIKGKEDRNLRFIQDISIEELKKIKGVGRVKAIQIKAIGELAKRMSKPLELKTIIKTPNDVANLLMDELRYEKRELVKIIILNTKNVVQKVVEISQGKNSSAMIEARNVFQEAIKMDMPKIILVHNHPSGDSTPSSADIKITQQLIEVSMLLQIELLDHIVIGDGNYTSIFSKYKSQK